MNNCIYDTLGGTLKGKVGASMAVATTVLLLLSTSALHGAQRVATLDETVRIAHTIVQGKLVDAEPRWVEDGRGRHIYTYATVESAVYWKGAGDQRIVVEWPGGRVGQITEEVSDIRSLRVGEDVILFLNKDLRPAVGIYSKALIVNGQVYDKKDITEVDKFLAAVADSAGTPKTGLIQPVEDTDLQKKRVRELTAQPAKKAKQPKPAEEETAMLLGEPDRAPLAGWTTIKSEDFEGAWPNDWVCTYNYTASGVPVTWATETYLKHAGSKGGWPHASAYDPWNYYLTSANPAPDPSKKSYMTYGPFSLVGATDARVTFWLDHDLGSGDSIIWYASTDGLSWYGQGITGGNSGGFVQRTFDLKAVPTIGNLCGQASVYIRFYCEADSVNSGNDGPFLDDIVIESYGDPPPPAPVISSISPASASAGTDTPVTITGSNFGASQGSSVVEFFYRSGQPKMPASVTSWSDTSISCTVPVGVINGYSGSAGSGPVTVTTAGGTSGGYTFIVPFGYGQRKWAGTSPVLTYLINENCTDCTGEGSAFSAGGITWNSAGSKFRFEYGGSHTATVSSGNSVNEVLWGSFPGEPTVVARATYWYSGSTIVECDIVFNDPDYAWDTSGTPSGSERDVQTIASHELGHWLSLRDLYGAIGDSVNDDGKVMYGFSSAADVKRDLTTGDRDGIRWIYGLDTTAPTFSSIAATPSLAKLGTAVTITFTASETLSANPAVTINSHAATYQSNSGNNYTYSYTIQSSDSDGDATIAISGSDPAGNPGSASNTTTLDVDKTAPTVTINQAGGQADPTGGSPINFTVVFSESVSGFATGDVTITGTAPGTKTGTVTGSGTTYNVAVSGMTGSGTVIANIAADKAADAAGNGNTASTSTDNTVTYDVTPPTVTINQAGGQADPTSGSPINFTVVFSESVSAFATGDVTITGTAPGTKTGTVTGSGTTYNVAVSGMTGSGTVVANIEAGKATDAAGNGNTASTSTDNTVTYDVTDPTITSVTSTTANGTYGYSAAINVTLNFSEAVTLAGGNLVITLETGTTDREVTIGTISGSDTASGVYTVIAGDASTDLFVKSIGLSAGTLRDAVGNDADLSIPPGQNLDDNKDIVIDTTSTIEIVSAHGTADLEVGTHTNVYGTVLTNSVSSPDTQGTVQYVCTGWTMTGNEPASGANNVMVMTHTNDAVLTWTWTTNHIGDFGDLPASYNLTTLSDNGARHATGTVYLGTSIDTESDGIESTAADGDDNDNTDDEDGIAVAGSWQEGTDGGTIKVVVTGGSGYLSGWIDWAGNNQFTDAGDQVLDMVAVSAGAQTNTFDIPEGAISSAGTYTNFARFRLWTNSTPALTTTGLVENGEVEDYRLVFKRFAVDLPSAVEAWGWNVYGERDVPASLDNAVSVAGGGFHCLALRDNGTVATWGRNNVGQCNVPSGLTDVTAVAGGYLHSLALRADGTVVAWGFNHYGQCDIPIGLNNAVALAGGERHTLALRSDGTVDAWGDNGYSQLDVPTDLSNAVAVACGFSHSMALRDDGTVVAWGRNHDGQCTVPSGLTNVTAVAAGGFFSLALQDDGTVVAWGRNHDGQCDVPSGLTNVIAVAGGYEHVLALQEDGTVVAWGDNGYGQCDVPSGLTNVATVACSTWHSLALGSGHEFVVNSVYGTPTPSTGTNRFIDAHVLDCFVDPVAVGATQYAATGWIATGSAPSSGSSNRVAFAITNDTILTWLWSTNFWLESTTQGAGTVNVASGWYALGSDVVMTASPLAGHTFLEWSGDTAGCTINGTEITVPMTGPKSIQARFDGPVFGIGPEALMFTGRALEEISEQKTITVTNTGLGSLDYSIDSYFWLSVNPSSGTLTPGQSAQHTVSVSTLGLAPGTHYGTVTVSDPFATNNPQVVNVILSLAQTSPPTRIEAWGWNDLGQCDVPGSLSNAVSVAGGGFHCLALRDNGTVATWGRNDAGQCDVPSGLTNVTAVAGAHQHSLALRDNGTVTAWGYNYYGQCDIPAGLSNVVALAGGERHTLALRSDGTVDAWGDNGYSQLDVPTDLSNAVAVACGFSHSMALRDDGTVVAWGRNHDGQCTVPSGLTNVTAVAAGGFFSLALQDDGTVVAWGRNHDGQCDVPSGLTNVIAVAGGYEHVLALQEDGTVVAWGDNGYGQCDVPSGLANVATVACGTWHSLALFPFADDFGDLPADYNLTTFTDNGARHATGTVYLGTSIDIETNGQESAAAGGDDSDGDDDEDGIAVLGNWHDGQDGGAVTVEVTGGSGYLSAWIDWNDDNDFADTGEQVLDMTAVSAGSQTVTFDIPSGAISSAGTYTNFSRFRLWTNSTPALTLTGAVNNGEVEDHLMVYPGVLAYKKWDGGGVDNDWSTDNNWSPDGAPTPGSGNDLHFAGSTRLSPYQDAGSYPDWHNMYFDASAGAFTITGNGIDLFGKIENNSANTQVFSLDDLSISSAGVSLNPVAGDLTIGDGGGSVWNNGNTLHVYGDGGHTLTLANDVIGAGDFHVHENSVVEFATDQSYTGDTTVESGTVHVASGVSLASSNIYVRNGGTLTVDGSIAGSSLMADSNATVSGTGTLGANTIYGTVAPGGSVGTLSAGHTTWGTNGTYVWEVNDIAGGYGNPPGWDKIDISGDLTNAATSGNKFTISITSLNGSSPGQAANFDNSLNYTCKIATVSGSIVGFDITKFTVDDSGFQNDMAEGSWSVRQNGSDVELLFSKVPTLALLTSFRAFVRGGDVVLQWKTSSESGTVGFMLEKRKEDGSYSAVNNEMIPGNIFSTSTATYECIDPAARLGGTYTYRLIEIESNGNRRYMGPYTVTVDGLELTLEDWSRDTFSGDDLEDSNVSGETADADGDGLSNFEEYLLGSDATELSSSFRITGILHSDNGTEIRWLSEEERVYTVEVADTPGGGFVPVFTNVPATPPANVITDTVERPNGAIYRIRLSLPTE